MSVVKLGAAEVHISEGMLSIAARLRETADAIEKGQVRAIAMCQVEAGPDRIVTRDWAAMSDWLTLTGGLFCLMQAVSQ